jgi:hypothetical protein
MNGNNGVGQTETGSLFAHPSPVDDPAFHFSASPRTGTILATISRMA